MKIVAIAGSPKGETSVTMQYVEFLRQQLSAHELHVFQADHRYYRKHGFYDFPQRALGRRLLNPLISLLFRVPGIRRRFDAMVKTKMVEPYGKVLKENAPAASPPS